MTRVAIALLLACGCRQGYFADSPDAASPFAPVSWTPFATTPDDLGKAGMPLVAVGDAFVGFGGLPHTDTSTWRFADGAWSALPIGTPPAGRDGHCATALPAGVLFTGGVTDAGNAPSTVLSAAAYQSVAADRPPAGSGCVAGYLERTGTAIVYGGTLTPDDTYAFDGTAWTKLTPDATPGGRSGAAVVVDPGETTDAGTTDFLVMFGGLNGDVEADDTWIYNGSTWAQLSTYADVNDETTFQPRPSGRTDAQVVMDPVRRLLYVFGGKRQGVYLNDLWMLDLASRRWSQRFLASTDAGADSVPAGRARASVAYDTAGERMLMFGGQSDSGLLMDGWALTVTH